MPGRYAVGAHPALQAGHSQLQPGEELFAFLDDTYVVSTPDRTVPALDLLHGHFAQNACERGPTFGQNQVQ